jgi:hypothetical protein
VIAAARNRVRWTWNRAEYVARTEGPGTLARRTLAMAGLAAKDAVPEQVLLRPAATPISHACAAAWPRSVLVLGPPADGSPAALRLARRARQLGDLGIPVMAVDPGQRWRPAAQLGSVALIHPQSWSASLPAVLDEAHRLRQRVVFDVDDVADEVPTGADALLVTQESAAAALRPRVPDAAVHAIDADASGTALAGLLAAMRGAR